MASFDQKTKAVSLGLLPPGSKIGPLESVGAEQDEPSASDTELSTKLEGVDVEQENHSTSDTELSTKRESVDVKKKEPSTSDTKPKENILPKPMKAKATNPNPEVFSNLVPSMQTVVPSAVAPIGDQNGIEESKLEGDLPMIPTQGAKSLLPVPTSLVPTTKGVSNLGQKPDQDGHSSSIENLEAYEDPETLHISGAVFAICEDHVEEDFLGRGGQRSLQTVFQPAPPIGGKRSAHLNSALDGMSEDVVCQTTPSLGTAGSPDQSGGLPQGYKKRMLEGAAFDPGGRPLLIDEA